MPNSSYTIVNYYCIIQITIVYLLVNQACVFVTDCINIHGENQLNRQIDGSTNRWINAAQVLELE